MSDKKLFVWDFHGVLEKGNDNAVVTITNRALEMGNYPRRLSEEESKILSGKFWHEYFSFLLPKSAPEEWLHLQQSCFEISKNHPEIIAQNISLNDHALDVLQIIQEKGHEQILLSNTQPETLTHFISLVGIENYFPSFMRFGINAHQKSESTKSACLKKFLMNKNYPGGIVSVGDSPADVALVANYPKGIGYLYSHPGLEHRINDYPRKIHDLRDVLQEA